MGALTRDRDEYLSREPAFPLGTCSRDNYSCYLYEYVPHGLEVKALYDYVRSARA